MIDSDAAEAVVALMSGPGAVRVLAELDGGPRGYSELALATGMQHKTLDRAPRRLEGAGLAARVARRTRAHPSAIRTHYRLTPRARALLVVITALTGWWNEHEHM